MPYLHRRIAQLTKLLNETGRPGSVLLSSAPQVLRSGDSHYPFRQDSEFYYFTESELKDAVLLVRGDTKECTLFVPKPNKLKIVWEGKGEDASQVAKRIGATLVATDSLHRDILLKLKDSEVVYHQNRQGSKSWNFAESRIKIPYADVRGYPREFLPSAAITSKMRLIKDANEIKLIKAAAKITAASLTDALAFAKPGVLEKEIVSRIENGYRARGADVAFSTIVGGGISAATLHYETAHRKLKNEDLLLVDLGAEYKLYAADITRTVPISGHFSKEYRILYTAVLNAQMAAIKRIKHGAKIQTLYDAVVEHLVDGLLQLKVLKGSAKANIKKKTYLPYFPHGLGHGLGLDVHDVGDFRGSAGGILQEGVVYTVEPGLYFPKPIGKLPACGIRIEDDVLVTRKGCEVLTPELPKKPDEVEAWMQKIISKKI